MLHLVHVSLLLTCICFCFSIAQSTAIFTVSYFCLYCIWRDNTSVDETNNDVAAVWKIEVRLQWMILLKVLHYMYSCEQSMMSLKTTMNRKGNILSILMTEAFHTQGRLEIKGVDQCKMFVLTQNEKFIMIRMTKTHSTSVTLYCQHNKHDPIKLKQCRHMIHMYSFEYSIGPMVCIFNFTL